MTSILRILPVETLSDIIDAVAEIDKEHDENDTQKIKLPFLNVRACSQTCSTFVPLSRKHIFKNVRFEILDLAHSFCNRVHGSRIGYPSPATSFLDLLVKTPEIAHYVKTLKLTLTTLLRDEKHQVAHRASLLSVIPKLTGLTTIVFGDIARYIEDWKDVVDILQPVLFGLMTLPTLKRLDVYRMQNLTLSTLSHCTTLRILNLQSVELANTDSPPNLLLDPIKLARIGIQASSTDLLPRIFGQKHGNPVFASDRLVTFYMMLDTTSNMDLATTFLLGAPPVEIIKFRVCGRIKAANAIEAIAPCLGTLKHLSLDITINESHIDPLSGIFRPLKKILSHSNLVYLDITINLDHCFYDGWNELENVLLGPGWSYLRRVNLKVIVYYWEPLDDRLLFAEDLQHLEERMQNQLQHLSASESVDFSLKIEREETDYLFEALHTVVM